MKKRYEGSEGHEGILAIYLLAQSLPDTTLDLEALLEAPMTLSDIVCHFMRNHYRGHYVHERMLKNFSPLDLIHLRELGILSMMHRDGVTHFRLRLSVEGKSTPLTHGRTPYSYSRTSEKNRLRWHEWTKRKALDKREAA